MELKQETKQGFDISLSVASNMEKLTITNDKTYSMVAEGIKTIKKEFKKQDAARKSLVKPLNDHVKFINDQFKPVTEELSRVEKILKSKVAEYDAEKERKRREAERIAREKAEAERRKKEEAARQQREKEEKARREAEELKRKAQAEADEKKRLALLKESKKQEVKAENASNMAIVNESMAENIEAPKIKKEQVTKGVSFVTVYKAVIESKEAFIKECVERGDFYYLDINESLLNRELQASQGMKKWSGIKVDKSTSTRVRS